MLRMLCMNLERAASAAVTAQQCEASRRSIGLLATDAIVYVAQGTKSLYLYTEHCISVSILQVCFIPARLARDSNKIAATVCFVLIDSLHLIN